MFIVGLISIFNAFIPIQKAEAYFVIELVASKCMKCFNETLKVLKNGLASFEGDLSYSTLIGPYHELLNEDNAESQLSSNVTPV